MSEPLIPCLSCNRHVFADACACPFCAVKLRVCEVTRAVGFSPQLSRAARLAAGAALVGVAACSGTSTTPLYGAPPMRDATVDVPADAGSGGAGGKSSSDGGVGGGTSPPADAGSDRGVVPLYGAAAPVPRKPVP